MPHAMRLLTLFCLTLLISSLLVLASTTEPHEQSRLDQLYLQYATLEDADLWDQATVEGWSSDFARGISEKDWEMFHPDLHRAAKLELVGHPRTRPSFVEIDTDGNGWVDREEFGRFVAHMETMPADLVDRLQTQHGIREGEQARWAGQKGLQPWEGGEVSRLLSYQRDYDGNIYAMMESGDATATSPQQGSISPGTAGRKVRIQNLLPLKDEPPATRDALSADRVFQALAAGGEHLTQEECRALGLDKIVKPAQWHLIEQLGGLNQARFIKLFHRFQFVPALVAAAEASRTAEQQQRVEAALTSCGTEVHCLSVDDVTSAWPGLEPSSIESPEWSRLGKLSTTKALGWANGQALIRAFASQFAQNREQQQQQQGRPSGTEHEELRDSSLEAGATAASAEPQHKPPAEPQHKAPAEPQQPTAAEQPGKHAAAEPAQPKQSSQEQDQPQEKQEPRQCAWHQTSGCHWRGRREPERDRGCEEEVPAGASGYCVCDGKVSAQAGCNHGPFRCAEHCRDAQEERRLKRQQEEHRQQHRELMRQQRQQEELYRNARAREPRVQMPHFGMHQELDPFVSRFW